LNILIITQVYFPDTVSVSQHLTDLAESLVDSGHSVTVATSRYAYDNKDTFPKISFHNGVKITRVKHTNFGKKKFLLRALNFLTCNISIFVKALFYREKIDLVFSTTSPPFLGFFGLVLSKIKKVPFYFWVMDLQPELAISSGLIKENSITAFFSRIIGNLIIKKSDKLFSIDRFMTNYLVNRGACHKKIVQAPVWPVSMGYFDGEKYANPFRIQNKYNNRIVVMYSGNHSYVHPLDTLLEAARVLKDDDRFLFAFVGGGVRTADVSNFKNQHKLKNIIQHPFQPRETFHISIAASDIQVVVLGDGQIGYTHPNKIYGAMFLGRPFLYIGPRPSHIEDIYSKTENNISVRHGEVYELVYKLKHFANMSEKEIFKIGENNRYFALKTFNPECLIDNIVGHFEK